MIYHGLINGHHAAYLPTTDGRVALTRLIEIATRLGAKDDDVLELRLLWDDNSIPSYITYYKKGNEDNA